MQLQDVHQALPMLAPKERLARVRKVCQVRPSGRDPKEEKEEMTPNMLRSNLATIYRYASEVPVDKEDFPVMAKSNFVPDSLLAFNACLTSRKRNNAVHFFIEDYRFERIWTQMERYATVLQKFTGAFSPDFSMFMDMPRPVQIWNLFRNRLCGAYWQSLGIEVVPTVAWAGPDSWDFCFSGLQKGTNVAVSTIGVIRYIAARRFFRAGYEAMMEAVKPKAILVYGREFPDKLPGNVHYYPYSFENNHRKRYPKKGGNDGR